MLKIIVDVLGGDSAIEYESESCRRARGDRERSLEVVRSTVVTKDRGAKIPVVKVIR